MGDSPKRTTPSQKAPPMTPATAETVGSTWYSYYSEEQDREYFHEPVSGVVSWVAPTCGPSGSSVFLGIEDEDSHNTPPPVKGPEAEDEGTDVMALKDVSAPRSLQMKLMYWAAALLATNLVLMLWTHYSLRQVIVEQVSPPIPETPTVVTIVEECEPCPTIAEPPAKQVEEQAPPLCEPVACEPVACEPVACEPVACEPVACEPVACEPVACEPVACEPVACEPVACEPCEEPPICENLVEYRCLPQTMAYDFESQAATSKYVQNVLRENLRALDQVMHHVQNALPEDESPSGLPKAVCNIPLAKRVVPECRDGAMMGNSNVYGMM